MTTREAGKYITGKLSQIYEEGESAAIAEIFIEKLTSTKKGDHVLMDRILDQKEVEELENGLQRLLKYEPVQYVVNEASFCGLRFYVDRNVLVPRPETEELVEWIISNCKFPVNTLDIVDIGSGSGCIAITLKRRIRKAMVSAIDVSGPALQVAKKNAAELGADINFLSMNFLEPDQWSSLGEFDIIVSNPPYVPEKDKNTMEANVLNFEPHEALFVTDDSPLAFYYAIADFGIDHLKKGGAIYLEMHAQLANQTAAVFSGKGYDVTIRKDMTGNERFLKSIKF